MSTTQVGRFRDPVDIILKDNILFNVNVNVLKYHCMYTKEM